MRNFVTRLTKFARPKYVRRVINNPEDAKQGLRTLRSSYRKDRLDYDQERLDRPSRLAALLGVDLETMKRYENELATNSPIKEYQRRLEHLEESNVESGTSSDMDSHTLYVTTRALKPEVTVETGVLHGAFDAHITAAMEENGQGTLTSLDLPGQPSEEFDYGYLIPDGLRDRWDLRLGDATEILDDVLSDVGPVDMFVHDSSHYPAHMRFEYETAYPHIKKGGVLASHDILLASTFTDFCEEHGMDYITVANTGIAVKS